MTVEKQITNIKPEFQDVYAALDFEVDRLCKEMKRLEEPTDPRERAEQNIKLLTVRWEVLGALVCLESMAEPVGQYYSIEGLWFLCHKLRKRNLADIIKPKAEEV